MPCPIPWAVGRRRQSVRVSWLPLIGGVHLSQGACFRFTQIIIIIDNEWREKRMCTIWWIEIGCTGCDPNWVQLQDSQQPAAQNSRARSCVSPSSPTNTQDVLFCPLPPPPTRQYNKVNNIMYCLLQSFRNPNFKYGPWYSRPSSWSETITFGP